VSPLPTIDAIPLQMNQLFYNLINNSLKFTKENVPPIIKITCRKLNEEEKKEEGLIDNIVYYEIIIKDNGIGFSQEYSEQIFGLFKRLNDKNYFPGSGIGLALCKKVMLNHNGVIHAEGKENEGAEFHLILPERK
jgi:two-component system CheB/CheR fusion protein